MKDNINYRNLNDKMIFWAMTGILIASHFLSIGYKEFLTSFYILKVLFFINMIFAGLTIILDFISNKNYIKYYEENSEENFIIPHQKTINIIKHYIEFISIILFIILYTILYFTVI